ncbi:MAG: Exopolyphosphatase [Trizodia sp. TS-e1964]|nr:MAG: Exopolyphosphatase [Trizodia sp. TS-e1964]
MAFSSKSLSAFLIQAKSALQAAISQSQKITLVIGNQSADLDSLSSSIIYAYVRSLAPRSTSQTSSRPTLHIPIANIPTAELQLRPEFLWLLNHAGLKETHIITLDDLHSDSTSRLDPLNTRWILVDHNSFLGQPGQLYSDRVVGVIDHHEEENKVPKDTGDEPRIVEKSGSCSSLVTEYCQQEWDNLSAQAEADGAQAQAWIAQAALLPLAAMLVDTNNLTSKSKTTPHDIAAVEHLESRILASPDMSAKYDRRAFYEEISAAKQNIDHLSLIEVLRRDYKEWEIRTSKNLGISSVIKPISWLQEKALKENPSTNSPALIASMETYAKSRNLSVLAIMTSFRSAKGKHRRELIVWALDPAFNPLFQKFGELAAAELELDDWVGIQGGMDDLNESKGVRRVWTQKNATKSRKEVAPLLRAALDQVSE